MTIGSCTNPKTGEIKTQFPVCLVMYHEFYLYEHLGIDTGRVSSLTDIPIAHLTPTSVSEVHTQSLLPIPARSAASAPTVMSFQYCESGNLNLRLVLPLGSAASGGNRVTNSVCISRGTVQCVRVALSKHTHTFYEPLISTKTTREPSTSVLSNNENEVADYIKRKDKSHLFLIPEMELY